MLKIYYVITKELVCSDPNSGDEYTTGIKNVDVYTVEHGEVEKFFDLEIRNEDNSEDEIQEWLDDNGYSEKEIEFKQL